MNAPGVRQGANVNLNSGSLLILLITGLVVNMIGLIQDCLLGTCLLEYVLHSLIQPPK
jgi:hypothetical protein